jgi:hypothetical protein
VPNPETLLPHPPEFSSVKQLFRRVEEDRTVSVDDWIVPPWQRSSVWSDEQQGLLALSILQGYPIGMIVLWDKGEAGSKVRVPVDGRQRITAIRRFMLGLVAIPNHAWLPEGLRGHQYRLGPEDDPSSTPLLSSDQKDLFDDYQLSLIEYDRATPVSQVMEIFVRLQGGTPLNKAEVRAALGGELCDFVSELTSPLAPVTEDSELEDGDEPEISGHTFFKRLSRNLKNRRKSHRAVCDYLLAEHLRPAEDKHWQSLLDLYREKATTLRSREKDAFRAALTSFTKACEVQGRDGPTLSPHLDSAFLIVTFFRAWVDLSSNYALPANYRFPEDLDHFEDDRAERKRDEAWAANFSAALSNAAYAKNRSDERHEIFMSWLLKRHSSVALKDPNRAFSREQKLAIFLRADRQCEWKDEDERCEIKFEDFRDLDADHIVKWSEGGPTTVENGRLLCVNHNRSNRPTAGTAS